MAISKRLRYEILRRDNHTCRYCGATAPDVKLTVDHVVPVALGGADEAPNLVTACGPCNTGKGSSSPAATLIAGVKEDALRHAQMIQVAYASLVERIGRREEYEAEFIENYGSKYLPTDWQRSLGRFFLMGVPVELVIDAAKIATLKTGLDWAGRFKYFCGILWNQVQAVEAVTALKATLAGRFFTEGGLEEFGINEWKNGWEAGYKRGLNAEPKIDWPPMAQEIPMEAAAQGRFVTESELERLILEAYEEGKDVGAKTAWHLVEGVEASAQRHYEECGHAS